MRKPRGRYKLVGQLQDRKLFVGVDEAGYGPNLGPMVVAGSAWLVPRKLTEDQFVELLLQESFSSDRWTCGCQHIPLGDSKKLYTPSSGLRSLELGLLAMWTLVSQLPCNVESLIQKVCSPDDLINAPPWYHELWELPIPEQTGLEQVVQQSEQPQLRRDEIFRLGQLASERLEKHGIELVSVQAKIIGEKVFNQRVLQLGSKGALLSQTTFELISRLLAERPEVEAEIFCDRQGGRKNYLPLLLDWMPDSWFVETRQSTARSSYRTTCGLQRELHFSVGGDSFAPTALGSMMAKYLRERLMESFNKHWRKLLPNIKPTAGYPQDAQRFRKLIEVVAEQKGFAIEDWWRSR